MKPRNYRAEILRHLKRHGVTTAGALAVQHLPVYSLPEQATHAAAVRAALDSLERDGLVSSGGKHKGHWWAT